MSRSPRPDAERGAGAPPENPERLLRRLEWTVLRRLDGLLQGDYRTLMRGFGLDLADLREYQYHDDVRHIDWNVTARLETPYVREYHEERELTAWFLVDLSPSVEYGGAGRGKRAVATELVAMLARVLTRHGNRVGAMFYGDRIDTVVPARSGRRQVLQLVHQMQARAPRARGSATDLGAFLREANGIMRRRCLVFLVSDFISVEGWGEALARLARRHEIVAVRLVDPMDRELPDLGLLTLEDAETGEQLFVDTASRGFRRRFLAAVERREAALREALGRAGVDAMALSTEGDLTDAVLRFSDLRRRRRRAPAGGGPAVLQEAAA